jgi:hypothetical protein
MMMMMFYEGHFVSMVHDPKPVRVQAEDNDGLSHSRESQFLHETRREKGDEEWNYVRVPPR